jgi:solute carrier family 34 (sodium-dependent phosphate cotransporter)
MTSSQESTVAQKNTALQVVFLLGVLGMFFASLELMEDSFKLMGGGVAEYLLKMASNPFVGLFIGILATSLVQSSSTTTTRTGIPCRGRQGGAGASCRITVSA